MYSWLILHITVLDTRSDLHFLCDNVITFVKTQTGLLCFNLNSKNFLQRLLFCLKKHALVSFYYYVSDD